MNKTLTISLVAVLAVVGGGSYMLINSEKNFSEYVPEPVVELMGDYLPDNFRAEKQSSVSTTEEALIEDVLEASPEIEEYVEEVEASSKMEQQEVEQTTPQVEVPTQVVEEVQAVVEINTMKQNEQDVSEKSDESIVDIAMQEIQKDLNGTSSSSDNASTDPNVKIIEKKIVAVSTKISKLDMENKELKEKFQNILRKNRELAKQLQDIDKQLMHSN